MMKIKKLIVFLLSAIFVVGGVSTLAGCGKKGGPTDFSVWIPQGENSSIYSGYSDNPTVKYLENKKWIGKDEKEVSLNFEWRIPVGSQEEDMVSALGSDNLADIVDASHITKVMPILQLYDEDYILDLTDYVDQYMPNYKAYLAANPDLAKTATNIMPDGSKKYLQIYAYQGEEWMWGGWMYRRDWIVKYGKNPSTGANFSGGYTDSSKGEWQDDVYFPSWYDNDIKQWYLTDVDPNWNGQDPVTIADWEWMLKIFKSAISAQSISNGYAMQLYYPGYFEMGDLITSFGGGGGTWYCDESRTNAKFGLTGNGFRSYLECMNDWYQAKYIDQNFNEKTTMFYQTDSSTIALGKVGLWYGMSSQGVGSLDSGKSNSAENGYTSGICVLGARQPINTTYGGDDVKYKIPKVMYQTSAEMRSFVISDKAKGKDLVALFKMMDYMYTDEGAQLAGYGLSKEQYAEYKEETGKTLPVLERYIDADGATWTKTDKGIKYNSNINSQAIEDALRGSKLWGVSPRTALMDKSGYGKSVVRMYDEWVHFRLKGEISTSMVSQLSTADSASYNDIKTNIRSWCEQNIYNYIKSSSSSYDVTVDSVWNGLTKQLTNRKANDATTILQNLLNKVNG